MKGRDKKMVEENKLTPDEGTLTDETEIESETENLSEGSEPEEKSQEPVVPEVDYRKKFSESTTENQILQAKIKQLEERLGKESRDEVPVESELKKLYPYWDDMTDVERKTVEENLSLKRRLSRLEQDFGGMKTETEWERQLGDFLEKAKILDKYPELEGKEKDFRDFAKKPTHKGVDLNVLADAFLYKTKGETMPTKKGAVLERGSGGPKTTPPTKKMTPEELKVLREADYKKYKEIITKHPNWIPSEIEK